MWYSEDLVDILACNVRLYKKEIVRCRRYEAYHADYSYNFVPPIMCVTKQDTWLKLMS